MLRTIPSQFIFELGRDITEQSEKDEYYGDNHQISQAMPHFDPGQLVRHKSFGLGRVEEFIDMGENSVVVVKFNTGQTKSLMVKYADLLKI
jgi:ribosomal 30S subunit maturation factor RimM